MSEQYILAVDDEVTARKFVAQVLSEDGYRALLAGSVDEAIGRLQANLSIALILCDINMPDRSGFDLIRFVAENLRFSDIPVVFVTGQADLTTVTQALALGARDYITKPYARDTLLGKVRLILNSGRGAVLVVSQDELDRALIIRTLACNGYRPTGAASAAEAREILRRGHIDFLITEIELPNSPRLDLLVFAKESYSRIPVFIIQRNTDRVGEEGLVAAGADGAIHRPFSNTEILAKIENYRRVRRNTVIREMEVLNRLRDRARSE